ncbi:hypothetical protein FEZ59_19095 [Rhodococcus sp. MS13]|nr:hypothetical protein [Rhodococcus sp. MS13]
MYRSCDGGNASRSCRCRCRCYRHRCCRCYCRRCCRSCRFRCHCFHRHCCRQVGRRRWQGRPIRQGRRYPSGTSQQQASSLAVVAGSSTFLPDTYVRPAKNCGRLIVPIAPDTPSLHFRQTCIRPRIIPHLEAQRSGSAVAIV